MTSRSRTPMQVFGIRNGIAPSKFKVRKNWSSDTIKQSMFKENNDILVSAIVEKIEGSFPVIEIQPGIGDLTVALLDNNNISIVHAFEENDANRDMLLNNLSEFGFDEKRIDVRSDIFDNIGGYTNAVIIVHHIDLNYVEEFLSKNKTCRMIVIKTSNEISSINAVNWTLMDNLQLESYTFHFLTPMSGLDVNSVEEILDLNDDYIAWLERLREFLYVFLLERVTGITSENILDILGNDIMPLWARAFKHPSFDPNDNYEELEFVGDRVLETTFTVYLMRRYPKIKKDVGTKIKSNYLSTGWQGNQAKSFRFDALIKSSNVNISPKILEDTFESFIGALFVAGDAAFPQGTGYILCYNFINSLLSPVEFTLDLHSNMDPTSALKEIIDALRWSSGTGSPFQYEYSSSEDGIITAKLLTPEKGILYSRQKGWKISRILGVGKSMVKKQAEKAACSDALEKLYVEAPELSNPETLNQLKMERKLQENPILKDLYTRTIEKSSNEGYPVPKIKGVMGDVSSNLVSLYVMVDGKEIVLARGKGKSHFDAQLNAYRVYLGDESE